jgi:hypothetical protein
MADTKLSALTELAAQPASDDEVYIRDVSEAASAESKRITIANLLAGAGATIVTGSYAGNNGADRQITVGFKCSLVIIIGYFNASLQGEWVLIPNNTQQHNAASTYHHNDVGNCYLHATDGFWVDNVTVGGTLDSNENGVTYYYWAISE